MRPDHRLARELGRDHDARSPSRQPAPRARPRSPFAPASGAGADRRARPMGRGARRPRAPAPNAPPRAPPDARCMEPRSRPGRAGPGAARSARRTPATANGIHGGERVGNVHVVANQSPGAVERRPARRLADRLRRGARVGRPPPRKRAQQPGRLGRTGPQRVDRRRPVPGVAVIEAPLDGHHDRLPAGLGKMAGERRRPLARGPDHRRVVEGEQDDGSRRPAGRRLGPHRRGSSPGVTK